MSSTKIKQLIFLQVLAALVISAVSCNSNEENEDIDIVVTQSIVAITKFNLQANDSVMAHLDSVFFSIDLNNGVIFNADSLPKGTNVSKLIPSITFANTMYKAKLKFVQENGTDTIVDYLTNPDDTIDFSKPVILDVVAQDTTSAFTYTIKVNVHNQEPDSLMWDKMATSPLPSRYSNPVAQKTLFKDSTAYCFIEERTGEYTLSTSRELNEGVWNKENVVFEFTPDVESFTSTTDSFWMLSKEGNLYESQNGSVWENTGTTWVSITGGYGSVLLGIRENEDNFLHTCYPMPEGYKETVIDPQFPIYDTSALGVMQTNWADTDFAILTGGKTADGSLSNAVWAFDGDSWAIINDTDLPALYQPMMARYVVYRDTPYIFLKRVLDVWLLFGGIDEKNEMNRVIYVSYNNGVNWFKASDLMQLPKFVPTLKGADVIVADYNLTADLSDAWTVQESPENTTRTRASYTIDGFDITWVCPYMYIFGGYESNDLLSTNIWRGVIARLTFTPII